MSGTRDAKISRTRLAAVMTLAAATWALGGCASDSSYGGGTTTSMSVGVGYYGGYGGYYGGYYPAYPPVVVVPPDRPGTPGDGQIGNRPTTLPSEVNRPAQAAPMPSSRPSNVSRPTSRPSPRPASRPMPRRR